jgi:PAP2 superfamily protein
VQDVREMKAASAGGLIVVLYIVLTLATGRVGLGDFAGFVMMYLQTSFALWSAVGVIWMLAKLYRERPAAGKPPASPFAVLATSVRERWERDRFISWLWPPILFGILMATFNAFKQMVLPVAGYGFDPVAARIDRVLFLGNDAWRVTHALFSSPSASLAFDRAYHGWFVPMSLGVILCAWMPSASFRLRTQYLLSYLGVWVGIGSVLAFLMPSAGPCYYSKLVGPAPEFDALTSQLAHDQLASGAQFGSLAIQRMLFDAREVDHLVLGGGVSAMPSVHNALAVLFALAAFRLNKAAGWLFAAYAAVIWIGSIHLGWHYAADGLVAAALTFAIWAMCGRIAARLDQPAFAPQVSPALA